MSTTKLTSYDRATIVEWYENGWYSQRELSEIYGVSRSTIRRVIEDDRNFCGRSSSGVGLSTYSEVGQPSYTDEPEVGHPLTEGGPVVDDTPPWWLGVGLVGLTCAAAAFIGWVLYHATL